MAGTANPSSNPISDSRVTRCAEDGIPPPGNAPRHEGATHRRGVSASSYTIGRRERLLPTPQNSHEVAECDIFAPIWIAKRAAKKSPAQSWIAGDMMRRPLSAIANISRARSPFPTTQVDYIEGNSHIPSVQGFRLVDFTSAAPINPSDRIDGNFGVRLCIGQHHTDIADARVVLYLDRCARYPPRCLRMRYANCARIERITASISPKNHWVLHFSAIRVLA